MCACACVYAECEHLYAPVAPNACVAIHFDLHFAVDLHCAVDLHFLARDLHCAIDTIPTFTV